MTFAQWLAEGRFAVALEITPPQRRLPKVLLRRARLLGDAAQAVNVIQRPDRQSSLEASLELKAAGIEPVWHLVTRGRSREEVAGEVGRAAAGGIGQVLCIRGDRAVAAEAERELSVREAVAMVRSAMPGAVIGATLNQYVADREAALRNLYPKLRAGATYIQTQPTFEGGPLGRAAAEVRSEAPGTAVVAMVMPLVSAEAGERVARRIGVELPVRLRDLLAAGDEAAAWRFFADTVAALADSGVVQGVAVMTFEMDPPPEVGERIVAALQAAGVV